MPSAKNSLTALLASTVLVVTPASALAQSAGDQQYADPLADTPSQKDSGSGNSGAQGNSPSSGSQGSAGSTSSGSSGSAQSQAAPAQPTTGQSAGQLPRTGTDGALLLAGGAVLLGSGMLLRLGVTARRDPA